MPDWTPIKNANTVVMELITNSYIRKADFHHMAQPTYFNYESAKSLKLLNKNQFSYLHNFLVYSY